MFRTSVSDAQPQGAGRSLVSDKTREDNARCASQALSRLFLDIRCGGFYPTEEFGASELPDEPAFDVGRHFTWRSQRGLE